jgi:hypothetical protein
LNVNLGQDPFALGKLGEPGPGALGIRTEGGLISKDKLTSLPLPPVLTYTFEACFWVSWICYTLTEAGQRAEAGRGGWKESRENPWVSTQEVHKHTFEVWGFLFCKACGYAATSCPARGSAQQNLRNLLSLGSKLPQEILGLEVQGSSGYSFPHLAPATLGLLSPVPGK